MQIGAQRIPPANAVAFAGGIDVARHTASRCKSGWRCEGQIAWYARTMAFVCSVFRAWIWVAVKATC